MFKKFLLLFLITAPLGAVETKTVSDSGYQSLWLWQLSNTALIDKEGISLAKESKKDFSTSSVLWTMSEIKGKTYFATSEIARIFTIENGVESTIYSNTNKTLISALAELPEGFLAASAPEAELLRFDAQGVLVTNITLSNSYLWDFVSRPGGGYDVLASLPAQIYTYTNGMLSKPLDFPDEEHLVRGMYIGNTLWVLSEKALYKKEGDKIIAVAAFNGVAANFVFHNGGFYVIQSVTTPAKTPDEKDQVISSLVFVNPNGMLSELFSIPGFYFTAISAQGGTIHIGGDQFGLTASYDIAAKTVQYSALGTGKVLMIMPRPEGLRLLTAEESAIWSMGSNIAPQGEFISEVYDTGSLSQWGIFTANLSILPNTGVRFYVQSGVVKNTAYWGEWIEVLPGSKIDAPEGRYVRYKAVLTSRAPKNSPTVYGVSFPYTQRNLPPRIEKITAERRPNGLQISWAASDPNKDNLQYDVYLHDVGMPRVKITAEPLSSTNLLFSNDSFSSGLKRVTVVVSDLPSNAPESALTAELVTQPLVFDSEAPVFGPFKVEQKENKTAAVTFTATDNISPIKIAAYMINGRNPRTIRPMDEIFDSLSETFSVIVPQGAYVQFQVTDAAGNAASKGLFVP